MVGPNSEESSQTGGRAAAEKQKEGLLSSLKEFARELELIEGDRPTREISAPGSACPRVIKDRRGRPIDVWDANGQQISLFYPADSGYPYAYEIKNKDQRPIERGSRSGPSAFWAIYRDQEGLDYTPRPETAFPHPIIRIEVTEEGAVLGKASDGYQFRRDTSGVEFEAIYDKRGCLVEAIRRHNYGVDRTAWSYQEDGSTVAIESRFDGLVVQSTYDPWGRLLARQETRDGRSVNTVASYQLDGSYTVTREDSNGALVEQSRRRDGTLARSMATDRLTDETLIRSYDEKERLLKEERRSKDLSEVTAWRHGEDGWSEAYQTSSDGGSLEARYDSWGRLVLHRETTPQGVSMATFAYKEDGSYHVHRQTADGVEADEYFRQDGSRQHSQAKTADGQIVEVDYDDQGRPLRRTATTVFHYQEQR